MKKTNLAVLISICILTACGTARKKHTYSDKNTQVIELNDENILPEESFLENAESAGENSPAEDNFDIEMPEETQAEIVERKLFNLGKSPSQGEIKRFGRNLDNCFASTIQRLEEEDYYDKGLSYMIVPSGVVYPFSKTEVRCIAGSPYAQDIGKLFCEKFFECVKEKYGK
jgi:hypothetical protein